MADMPKPPGGWLPPQPPGSAGAGSAPSDEAAGLAAAAPTFGRAPRAVRPSSNLSTFSLALGIGGLLLLTVSVGLAVLVSLPASGAAWACAALDRRRARALDPGRPAPAAAGLALGIIGVVLGVAAVILWSVAIAGGDSPQDLLEQWRHALQRGQPGAIVDLGVREGR